MKYDLVIQLGSQVMYKNGQYELPNHTAMRTEACALALLSGIIAERAIICGGSNFGVRYDDIEILQPANFSFGAFADSDFNRKSEAAVIKDFLVNEYGVPSDQILAETLSATTDENAELLKILLRRRPMFTGNERICVLTFLFHMERALPAFLKAGINAEPLFVENVLAEHSPTGIDRVCQYYTTPKGGKQWPVERIRNLLGENHSLKELMTV